MQQMLQEFADALRKAPHRERELLAELHAKVHGDAARRPGETRQQWRRRLREQVKP